MERNVLFSVGQTFITPPSIRKFFIVLLFLSTLLLVNPFARANRICSEFKIKTHINPQVIDPHLDAVFLTYQQLETLLKKQNTKSKKLFFQLSVTTGKFTLVAYSGKKKARKLNESNSVQLAPKRPTNIDISSGDIILTSFETSGKKTMKYLKRLIKENVREIIFTPEIYTSENGKKYLRYVITTINKSGVEASALRENFIESINPSPPFKSY
jgi:hypothetical protein